MTAYDLRAEVRSVLDDGSLRSPAEIATKIAGDIPSRALRDVVRATLPGFVAQMVREHRTYSPPNFRSGHGSHDTHTASAAAGRSWWRDGVRDGWPRQLQNRLHVGGGEWTFLGDCTYENLKFIAAERETNADRNRAWARYYRNLAALLTDHDVKVVRDLPPEVLMDVLGGRS